MPPKKNVKNNVKAVLGQKKKPKKPQILHEEEIEKNLVVCKEARINKKLNIEEYRKKCTQEQEPISLE